VYGKHSDQITIQEPSVLLIDKVPSAYEYICIMRNEKLPNLYLKQTDLSLAFSRQELCEGLSIRYAQAT